MRISCLAGEANWLETKVDFWGKNDNKIIFITTHYIQRYPWINKLILYTFLKKKSRFFSILLSIVYKKHVVWNVCALDVLTFFNFSIWFYSYDLVTFRHLFRGSSKIKLEIGKKVSLMYNVHRTFLHSNNVYLDKKNYTHIIKQVWMKQLFFL